MTTPPRTEHDPVDGIGERTRPREQGSDTVGALAVEWHASRADGTTLVTVRVENTCEHPRQVRIDNLLDGQLAPPRSHGVPERGWDDDGVERRLAGGETLSIGYACDAPMTTPPVAVRDAPPGGDAEGTRVAEALRSLGDHAPPRAALPDDGSDPGGRSTSARTAGGGDSGDEPSCDPDSVDTGVDDAAVETGDDVLPGASTDFTPPVTDRTARTQDGDHESAVDVPPTIAAWFDTIEARLVTADRLGGDVREATPVVATLGGRAGVKTLAATLDDDAAALRAVAARAAALADRIDGTEVPDVGARG
jgi:hypothetical protein